MAQVWLVTGSSRGLGRAIVEAGLAAGNKVLATARGIESLADLSERYGDQVKLFALDVTDEAAANAVMSAIDLFGSLDVVINNAGYGNLSSIEDTPLSEFRAQIETNLFGKIIVTKAALAWRNWRNIPLHPARSSRGSSPSLGCSVIHHFAEWIQGPNRRNLIQIAADARIAPDWYWDVGQYLRIMETDSNSPLAP
jgi:NAD(P)-dependent dehydrogenase (short-subunit alcohol dehydrogenase family)